MRLLCTPAMAQAITVIDNQTIEVNQPPVTQYIENVKANLAGYQAEIERYTILRDNMQAIIDQAAVKGAEDAYDAASEPIKAGLPEKKHIEVNIAEPIEQPLDPAPELNKELPEEPMVVEGSI
jgi:hypothetical protein